MISVVIPVYNGEDVIGRCLESLECQDYKGQKEVIVVNDGSTDKTETVIRRFKGVRLLPQKNKGPAAARNHGIRKSRGSIILFTDADCVPEKGWLRKMVESFNDKRVVGVQGSYKTRQKGVVAKFSQIEIEERYDRMKRWNSVDFVGTYSAGYRRSVFKKFGYFDESFPLASGEDSDFSFRVSKGGGSMIFNPDAVVYHNHPSTLIKYLKVKFWRAYWRVLLYRKHKNKMIRESYTPQGLKLQIVLFGLFFISLIGAVFSEPLIALSGLFYVVFVLSILPFAVRAFGRDKKVGLASLVIIQLRSIIFGLGLFEGFLRNGGGK